MRSPSDIRRSALSQPRRRIIIGLIVVVLIILLFSLRRLAFLWTDQLWFSSIGQGHVFTTLLFVKVGLAFVFGLVFFVVLFGNLLLTDKLRAKELTFGPEDDVVRRFQNAVRPYARRIYAAIAVVVAFIAGLNATSQWQSYLLFAHSESFHQVDPLFHKDLGFYIFTLPFLSYIVSFMFASLVVILLITALFHYLNGGIRASRTSPRVSPQVKAHLSVIGAGIALVKALGYLVAKWQLVTSTNGYTEGAGYTDVHARIPALTILFYLSLAAMVILLVNIRTRGWSLPAVAVGLWAFVALVIGVIYPLILQTAKVSPAQSSLEKPYIQRNIAATRDAYGIDNVTYHNFVGSTTVTPTQIKAASATLNNIRVWDPNPQIALATVNRRQSIRSYYQFSTLAVDRYNINGTETPVLIGTRQINSSNLPATSWVNTHLQYTHGLGVAMLESNLADPNTGNPVFVVGNVPPVSTKGAPVLTQPDIYFGINQSGWVVANSKQPELDYQLNSGAQAGQPVETHYASTGGVQIGGFLRRTAFALRLGDFNLWVSNQVTSKSRIMFVRDVTAMAEKAAPFLSFDSQPYPVIVNGHVDYVLNGYTTSANYPYSTNASSESVSTTGGLPSSYNYVRNSVEVVVNAYSGAMKFYVRDANDPIIKSYEAAFPTLFTPLSKMPSTVRQHLRYPNDLFAMQAAVLGRYHITSASAFYNASDQWEVSPTTGAGSPSQALSVTLKTDTQGNLISSTLSPMSPLYEVMSLPNTNHQQLVTTDAYVPAGNTQTVQSLTAFVTATSDPNDYGDLNVYVTPRGTSVTGPVQADAEIQQNAKVSSIITPLDQHGSSVLLGNNLMVPLDQSVLYVRPLYVSSTSNSLPQLKYVIAVFNQDVGIETTLSAALSDVLGTSVGTGSSGSSTGTTKGLSAATYLQDATNEYELAQTALKAGNLGAYQADENKMYAYLTQAQTALKG